MAMPIFFSVYGIDVTVHDEGLGQCAQALEQDFHFFLDTPSQGKMLQTAKKNPAVELRIVSTKPDASLLPEKAAKQIHSEYVVYEGRNTQNRKCRWIDYHGRAILETQESKNHSEASLYCAEPALAHELAYLYLLSRIGVFLDRRGLHRVHALGIQNQNAGALICIPSGGGKSSLAIALLDQQEALGLLSDDSPLVDRAGRLYPFPMRLAFTSHATLPARWEEKTGRMERRKYGEKKLLSVKDLDSLPPRKSVEPKLFVVAERHGSKRLPKIRKISKRKALTVLLRDMVVGLGLPQLAELVLTKGIWTLPELLPTASSRTLAAARLVAKSRCIALELSTDHKANAALLLKTLQDSR